MYASTAGGARYRRLFPSRTRSRRSVDEISMFRAGSLRILA